MPPKQGRSPLLGGAKPWRAHHLGGAIDLQPVWCLSAGLDWKIGYHKKIFGTSCSMVFGSSVRRQTWHSPAMVCHDGVANPCCYIQVWKDMKQNSKRKKEIFCFLLPLLLLTVHCVSADMLSVPFATLNQLLLYLLAPPFKNMMRSGRWVAYSWYINEDIVDINVFQASPLHMPRCRISFLSELRLARTGLQNMLLSWLHSILFKRRKLTFDALSQYQEFPPGSTSGTLVAVLFKVADRRQPLVLFWI